MILPPPQRVNSASLQFPCADIQPYRGSTFSTIVWDDEIKWDNGYGLHFTNWRGWVQGTTAPAVRVCSAQVDKDVGPPSGFGIEV